jgi:acyl transferase domain-containing protein/acyl carrier protein
VPALRADRDEPEAILSALAELFVAGGEVDWDVVLSGMGVRGRRVPLPTYAFQHQRFWLQDAHTTTAQTAGEADEPFWSAVERGDVTELMDTLAPATTELTAEDWEPVLPALASWRRTRHERSVVDGWRYRVTWKPTGQKSTAPELTGRWLVIAPGTDGGEAECAEALRTHGAEVVVVHQPDAGRPATRDEWRSLLEKAVGDGAAPVGVVSLVGWDERPHPELPSLPLGTAATLTLVQGLGDAGIEAPLWCLTRGAVSAGPTDALTRPQQAMVWGLGRVVALEHPQRWGGLVDLPEAADARAWERLCGILAGDAGEDQMAVRPSGVFLRRLMPAPVATDRHEWTPTGTVLISGGTSGLGAHAARWIARFGTARLLLLSRRGLAAPGAEELVGELAAAGTPAEVVACDVGDRDRLAEVLAGIPADHPLTTVIHAAETRDDDPLDALDPARLNGVLRSKKTGAWNLHELTAGLPVTAFVLFSSGAAVWGGGGQGTYATANAFADAVAEHRRALDLPATAIAWGPWRRPGEDGEPDEAPTDMDRRGLGSMSPELAVRALEQAVRNRDTAIAVADVDWARFHPTFAVARPRPLLHDIPAVEALLADTGAPQDEVQSALADKLAGLDEKDRHKAVLELIVTHVAAVLGHTDTAAVTVHRPFRDLGFDSLTAVELRNRLKAATGLPLPATLIYDYPTPVVIADHVLEQLARTDGELVPVYESIASLESEAGRLVAERREDRAGTGDVADVVARLKAVVAQYESLLDPDSAGDPAANDDISSASVSELINIIDEEFGSVAN